MIGIISGEGGTRSTGSNNFHEHETVSNPPSSLQASQLTRGLREFVCFGLLLPASPVREKTWPGKKIIITAHKVSCVTP